ncbi:hypothetical protein PG997_010919 [Apiospora hydei]|uniref:Mitochondrial zinc maintenance protein 1, mitochondrial n=1 Tax=Apiospora hydei TaxID=1337664 RepID=A0ABR1VK86_9PEZI
MRPSLTFRCTGDQPILEAAHNQIRLGFRQHANLKPSDPKFADEIRHAEDVATILKQNVVQGKREGDTYSMLWLRSDAVQDGWIGRLLTRDFPELRIHEHVERGDNDTVKVAGGKTVKVTPGKTCSN